MTKEVLKVLLIMPKYAYYNAMSDSVKASALNIVKQSINEYHKDPVKVLIEDKMAIDTLEGKELLSVSQPRDLGQITNLNVFSDYSSRVADMFSQAVSIAMPNAEYKTPVYTLMFTDKNKYRQQFVDMYRDRVHDAIRAYGRAKKVIHIFEGNKQSKNMLVPEPQENDGILYVVTSLDTGVTHGIYSGSWIDSTVTKIIIGGIYNE